MNNSMRPVDYVRELQVAQWREGHWTPVEQLCSQHFPELNPTVDEWLELILAEYDLRKRLGERPVCGEYTERFPLLRERLPSLIAIAEQFEAIQNDKSDLERTRDSSALAGRIGNPSEQSSHDKSNRGPTESFANDQTADLHESRSESSLAVVPECGMKVGKYRLVEKLGQGGMGTVFRASHSLIDHHVALKLMLPHLVGHPSLQKRFLKEAQVCVGLQHPNLVRTFDIDEDGGCLYMTMELLSGCHLAERVNEGGPLSSLETANIIRQVAEGLAYAHAQGIIHRDVKPQNLMLTDDGQVKVLDLGLAKLLGNFDGDASPDNSQGAENVWRKKLEKPSDDLVSQDGRLTYVGTILGTLGYMSREQATNPGVADVRNDIFSLGCTAYFLLTGRSIHGHRSPREILSRLISQVQWSDFPFDGICDPWRELLSKMLAWNAKDRFDSMQEVMAAIDAAFELGRPWRPDPDNLLQLKRKLIELQLVSEEQWNYAEDYNDSLSAGTGTLSPTWNRTSSRIPTPALQFLFRLTQTLYPPTGEVILTQYQVQQILAGHARTLRQGKLLIRESLNTGWKGEVFLVRDADSHRHETLRMLPIEVLHGLESEPDAASAVKQVGACLQRFEHPNVAKIYRFEPQGDWLLITSEHLRGDTLRKAVTSSQPKTSRMSAREMLTTAVELACGVQYVHEQGYLHLDLSPDRWIKRETGSWCLLDAGWARLLLNKQWKFMPQSAGLPPVLPPELMEGLANVSPLTDIYALGQVFRFLMSGDFPFRSLKLSELKRPNLPSVFPASPSRSSESITRSIRSLRKPRSNNTLSAEAARDWKVEWNQLVNSMTSADMSVRPQTVAKVVRTLREIAELTQAEYPGETGMEGDSIRQEKSQSSISERLRRLFGQDR